MSLSCGQDKPLSCPKNAYFSCVICVYFVAFFIDHPVSLINQFSAADRTDCTVTLQTRQTNRLDCQGERKQNTVEM